LRPHNRSIRGGLFRIQKSLPEFLSAAARSAAATDALHDANLLQDIKKRLGVAALEAEMADHFGYDWIEVEGNNTGNSRNGTSSKRITDGGRVLGRSLDTQSSRFARCLTQAPGPSTIRAT